ncbi:unnamed protein product [Clonostachys chloroleuca]|uniref:Cytochrome P450 n=1 Tax=Clonostachys chloroleuca TaxID=1926264 RepID=A0AA35MDK5_9HYPO|nr:unnamed protein product [Clonostachys chloroleuca]
MMSNTTLGGFLPLPFDSLELPRLSIQRTATYLPARPAAGFSLIMLVIVFFWASQKTSRTATIIGFAKQRYRAWAYLFAGPGIIQHEFLKSLGKPFEVHAPDVRMVFVSSPEHIKELDRAPDTVLSLNGAAKHLLPDLSLLAHSRWEELLSTKPTVNGAISAPLYPMMINMVVLLNARSLFGEELIKNQRFMNSALGYVEETLLNAEIIKLLPKFLVPARIAEKDQRNLGQSTPQRNDCIQWIIDTAPKQNAWTAERVIYELMAIWFGSVHILSTTIVYVVHDLCLHPEYIDPIRRELEASYDEFERTGHGLPLLDSFIKESARLTPVESMSVRRCALRPFSMSDGTKLEVGEWACAPAGAINTREDYYPFPKSLSGFRFVDSALLAAIDEDTNPPAARQAKHSKLADVDHSFLMWGTGRMACPGRFYSAAFMKIIVAQLLMNYDFTLANPEAPRWISWRVTKIPRPWTKLVFTSRK